MSITFTLNDEAVNDQTAGQQTGDSGDGFTDTDVAYSSLPTAFQNYLTGLGLSPTFPTNVYVATKTDSVTVDATAGSQLAGTSFTDSSGGALDGDDSGLTTVGGKAILLYADGSNTVIGKYDSGNDGIADAIAFVILKEDVFNAGKTSDAVTFHIVTYVPIFHGDSTDPDDAVNLGDHLRLAAGETTTFSFAGAPSGSNLFMTFGNPNSTQIVVIGHHPLNQSEGGNITTGDVLNISQAGSTTSFGVNGNAINPTEGAYITYVSGANTNFLVPNLDQNEADVEANIDFQNVVNATGASFTVNQTNPGIGPVTVKISAFSTGYEPGTGFVDGLTNDQHVNITSFSLTNVVVKNGNTQYFPAATIDNDGNLIITGLSTGDTVSWTTTATHNRVLIENISDNDGVTGNDNNTFDIGGFGLATPSSASTSVGQQIVIEDDGPTAGIVQGAPTVAHDETAGVQVDADDTTAAGVVALFAGVSNVSTDLSPTGYAQDPNAVVTSTGSATGTDGGTIAFSLAVSATGVDSGLDTTDGTGIFLFKEGNLVVGRIGGAAGAAAFAVAINSATGVVSVAQYASIHHPTPGGSYDESVSITDSALLAVVTVTDGDGDIATNSTGIGDAVQFQDDGPTAGIAQGAPTVAHDETAGVQPDADDTTAPAVVALFSGVSNVSTDLSPSGYAQDANAVVSSTGSSFGADQEGGTTAFSLAVSAAGVDSGLDTTAGTSIFLFKEGNLVVGRIGGAGGPAAFAVAIDSATGVVSVAQYASIHHPTPGGSYDKSVSINDSALLAVVTVTDGDGDTATNSTGIGDAVQFQDDGPTAGIVQGAPTVAHDETAGVQVDADDTTAAGVVALFAGVSNVSTDLSPSGYAQDANAVVSSTGSSFGADQEGGTTAFSLAVSAAGVDSGLDTTDGTGIFLFKEGNLVVGRIGGAAGAAAFAVAINSTTGVVSVAQYASIHHPTPGGSYDESVSITDSALLAVVTVTDGDGDIATNSTGIGDAVQFQDDGPTAGIAQGTPTVAHDETAGVQGDADDTTAAAVVALFSGVSNVSTGLSPTGYAQDPSAVVSSTGSSLGADQEGGTTAFSLAVSAAGVDSGLDTTDGTSIFLFKEGDLVVGRIGGAAGAAAFAVAINSATGVVSLAQYASILHPTPGNSYDESVSITDSALLAVVTVTDGDGDTATNSTGIGDAVQFQDDGPTITVPFDGDPGTAGIQHETLANTLNAFASGVFGYNIGADSHPASFYDTTHSDFVDVNASLAGVQIGLTGSVDNAQNPGITQAVATLTAETDTSASFDFSFHYDKDPITAGVQDATAGGTLVFDKAADTYTVTLTDVIDGFSFSLLHTAELVAKAPTGNTGHPLIVAEQLTPNGDPDPFFVQFTANSTTSSIGFGFNSTGDGATVGDTTFNNGGATHDLVTNLHEDWVSATQATNGVAGDTIQKGEALTLRFFQEDILGDVDPNSANGGTERLDPTTSASGVVVKFDGVGNSEDLVVILDLKNANGDEITRAINVQNSDLIKGNANVPAPYNTEFTLDNNDALLIIEQNDYTVAGETYQIQGIQIMQSSNGLTGDAINLIGTTGTNGGSNATGGLTAWDPTDNDVLKIVDIGFVQQTSGTIGASLDFAFQVADADADTTATQHVLVDVV